MLDALQKGGDAATVGGVLLSTSLHMARSLREIQTGRSVGVFEIMGIWWKVELWAIWVWINTY